MWIAAALFFVFHSLGMFIDEVWFHRRRNLANWERWGHPLDTLTVLICYLLALTLHRSHGNLWVYIGALIFSTIFITKDEWVHARVCPGSEMWLHACLFTLHPILLGFAGAYMLELGAGAAGAAWFGPFLMGQTTITGLFLLYQLLYWNGPWKPNLPHLP
jgi:hypothetical protein